MGSKPGETGRPLRGSERTQIRRHTHAHRNIHMTHLLLSRQAPAMVEQGDDPRYNLALGRISAIYSLHTRGLRPTVGQAGLLRIQQ